METETEPRRLLEVESRIFSIIRNVWRRFEVIVRPRRSTSFAQETRKTSETSEGRTRKGYRSACTEREIIRQKLLVSVHDEKPHLVVCAELRSGQIRTSAHANQSVAVLEASRNREDLRKYRDESETNFVNSINQKVSDT